MHVVFGQVFEKPATPAAQVLYHVRHTPHIGRGELVAATGLSQPTITRAVSALSAEGLLHERRDLINTARPGRPVVPLELSSWPGILIGIAVDVTETLIGCYDSRGRLLREVRVPECAPEHPVREVLEYIMAAVHRIRNEIHLPLRALTFATASPFWIDLNWVATRLEYEFHVPVKAYDAAAAIALAEIQHNRSQSNVFVLFAENVVSAAWITEIGIESPNQFLSINQWLEYLIQGPKPSGVVFSGKQFQDPQRRAPIRARLNDELGSEVSLRLTRPDLETLRTISAALALSPLHSNPLAIARRVVATKGR